MELARLKDRQARLEAELKELSTHLKRFEERLTSASVLPSAVAAPLAVSATAGSPPAQPSIQPAVPRQTMAVPPIIGAPVAPRPVASEVAKVAATPPPASEASTAQARPLSPPGLPTLPVTPAIPPKPAELLSRSVPATSPPPEARSFEMRLGTYWLVRVGIVMVLTGLVFFGNLAYQNYISRLGPGGKIILLYLASTVLLGLGWWWQRRAAKETLRNYAQVLFAGGWAAFYFTTYAAHHVERLRIISSATWDGVLLFVCAGWMVWVADRKKSEVMALLAVGLAYYTSIITRVGYFTLYSNLVLTVAAVFFLVRNRWAVLSFGSLLASYAAYGFWRFFDGAAWHWASPAEGLWSGTYFLIAYWVVFTSGVFLCRDAKFAGQNRASFLTLNNGAFFGGFLLTMLQVQEGGFWKFSLIYGGVLLALSELARRILTAEPLSRNAYLTQGLLLVTVGLISKFAGLQLALILATESVVLLRLSDLRENLILRVGAYVSAALAVGWGMDGMRQNDVSGLWLAIGLGIMMMVNTWFAHRRTVSEAKLVIRPQPSYFAVLGLAIWLVATWNNSSRETFPLFLALEAVLLTASTYVLRIREVTLFGQGYLVVAQLAWFVNWMELGSSPPWWQPLLVIGISLALSHWWQHQKILPVENQLRLAWQYVYALATVGVLYCWWSARVQPAPWLVLSSALALGLTAYGVLTRAWAVALCGQLFVVVSTIGFMLQVAQDRPGWAFALAPVAVLGVLSAATVNWFERRPSENLKVRQPLLEAALVYRWVALAMSIAWICEYVPARERTWLLALVGAGIFGWAGRKRSREALFFSAPYTVTALVLFWLPLMEAPRVYWPNLVAIVTLLGQRQIARRQPDRYELGPEVHGAIILAGGLSLWLFVSRWVLEQASGFYLTASWSALALALFACGIFLRERMYRWLGLGILTCALGRVLIFDVWKLETIYRVLSFMALGIVLLVLGFIYNKYQEKIKQWL
jgi:uncharacterized membrane protein